MKFHFPDYSKERVESFLDVNGFIVLRSQTELFGKIQDPYFVVCRREGLIVQGAFTHMHYLPDTWMLL